MRKVLYVSHSHASFLVGGVEIYASSLFRTMQRSPDFEPLSLSRAGPPFSPDDAVPPGNPISAVGGEANQYLLYTEYEAYDHLYGRLDDKNVLTGAYRDFLLAHKPDVVHFQHTIYLGYDIVRITRNALPDVPIVCTLQDYIPICHRDGQMVRTGTEQLCLEESPRRCHECFPDISPQTFFMRKRFVQSHLSLIDYFLVPSRFPYDRYVEWGIPEDKIQVESYGIVPVTDRLPDEPAHRSRNRFGFFGQLNPYKGADVLLEAMARLGSDFDGHLWIFGANLDKQGPEFRERFESLLEGERATVTFAGPYERSELGALMAGIDWVVVPSIWGETGPIVVMEAFEYGRPVICSDIGGMAEKVAHGVNGLHFRRGDPERLADAMRRAATEPDLWERLQSGIPGEPLRSMDDHVGVLTGIYNRLLAKRSGAAPDVPARAEVTRG